MTTKRIRVLFLVADFASKKEFFQSFDSQTEHLEFSFREFGSDRQFTRALSLTEDDIQNGTIDLVVVESGVYPQAMDLFISDLQIRNIPVARLVFGELPDVCDTILNLFADQDFCARSAQSLLLTV